MLKTVFKNDQFHWLDIVEPSPSELTGVAAQYGLHETSVQDCLDPEHLPKFERIGNVSFLISRAYDDQCSKDADTTRELTRKVALFAGPNFIITIHRKDQAFLAKLREKWSVDENAHAPDVKNLLLCDILSQVMNTFEKPLDDAIAQLETMEEEIFKRSSPRVIEEGYYLKRKAFVFKRMLHMLLDVVPKLSVGTDKASPLFQDLKESGDALYFYADELVENVNHLLALHLAMDSARTNEASHRTNEVVRVLTIFSVFFMPLNLIAGIYGMNFEVLPGAKNLYGFSLALTAMALTTLLIYFWFRRSGWMK